MTTLARRIFGVLEKSLGRQRMWRLSRALYLYARRDNNISLHDAGELLLVSAMVERSIRVKRGLTVVDVGANIGDWSAAVLSSVKERQAPRARVFAFEPVSRFYESLSKIGTQFAAQAEFRAVRAAVSNEEGVARFVVTAGDSGTHHLASDAFSERGEVVEVELTTLDAFCARENLNFIDLIKIDAEGFDPLVVAGAAQLLRAEKVDVVQFEYGALYLRSRCFLYDVFRQIEGGNYRIGRITPFGIELYDQWHFDLERFYGANYAIVHARAEADLPCRRVRYDRTNTYE